MKYILTLLTLVYTISIGYAQNKPQESEILEVAQKWANAWNGKINKDHMMSLHDERLQYYWRGKPMSYKEFDYVLEKFIIPVTNYNLKMKDPIITIIDNDAAVASFIWEDQNKNDPPGAVSLTVAKRDDVWKVVNIHESLVRPLPPDDVKEQFNRIAQQYHKDYMNAKCDGILPYLDEKLIIHENGEKWSYEKIKEYCPQLPVKPIISTDRTYKVLNDELVYEYVEHKYKGKSGDVFSESQALIWKYDNGSWKIIELGATRYKIKTN